MSALRPRVSVVIPTHNDASVLKRCLCSIESQTYDNIEIIVVDDMSTDETVEICRDHGVTVIEQESGMAEARRIGFEESSGEFIYHVDADMELTPGVIEECVEYCTNRGYDALIIPEQNVGHTYWTKSLKFGKEIHRREQDGNLRFLRSKLYRCVGGHDPKRLSGEDWDLHRRIDELSDSSIGHISSVVKHHISGLTFWDILRKHQRYAESQGTIEENNRRELKPIENMNRNFRHIELFARDPFHALGYISIQIYIFLLVRYYRFRDK